MAAAHALKPADDIDVKLSAALTNAKEAESTRQKRQAELITALSAVNKAEHEEGLLNAEVEQLKKAKYIASLPTSDELRQKEAELTKSINAAKRAAEPIFQQARQQKAIIRALEAERASVREKLQSYCDHQWQKICFGPDDGSFLQCSLCLKRAQEESC